MFLYRPEYYKIDTDETGNPTKGVGEVIIAKHRNGSLENVQLRFIGKFTKFADLERSSFPENDFDGLSSPKTFSSRMNEFGSNKKDLENDDVVPF